MVNIKFMIAQEAKTNRQMKSQPAKSHLYYCLYSERMLQKGERKNEVLEDGVKGSSHDRQYNPKLTTADITFTSNCNCTVQDKPSQQSGMHGEGVRWTLPISDEL